MNKKPAGFVFRADQFADYTIINPPQIGAEGNMCSFSLFHASFEPDIAAARRMGGTAFGRALEDLLIGSEVTPDASS